jgi:hypothetical protein
MAKGACRSPCWCSVGGNHLPNEGGPKNRPLGQEMQVMREQRMKDEYGQHSSAVVSVYSMLPEIFMGRSNYMSRLFSWHLLDQFCIVRCPAFRLCGV